MRNLVSLLLSLVASFGIFSGSGLFKTQGVEAAAAGLELSVESVVLANVGYSAYEDVRLRGADGSRTDVTKTAAWSAAGQNVSVSTEGRILALKKGKATVTVSYGGFVRTISVTVKSDRNLEKAYVLSGGTVLSTARLSGAAATLRNQILLRCSNMFHCVWTPAKDMAGFGGFVFKAGVKVQGIPYSYTDYLCDSKQFADALGSKYFYKGMKINGVVQPYYGSDCSGFVSIAWGLSERYNTELFIDNLIRGKFSRVGSYRPANPDPSALLAAYRELQPGDAVVMRQNGHGHIFLIAANEPSWSSGEVIAYEQTPPYCQLTVHTYEEMAQHLLMPFKMRNMS